MTSLFRKRKEREEPPERNMQGPARQPPTRPNVVSIIGRGMTLVGDCRSEGTIWIEGRVEGNVAAREAIVIGENGVVVGDIVTDDAIIYGRIRGRLTVASRVELHASSAVDGLIDTRRIQLKEGACVTASVNLTSQRSTSAT